MTTGERMRSDKESLYEEFRRRLAIARLDLAQTVAQTDEELRTLEAHQPGSLGEDAGTELVTAVLSRLEGHEKHELDEIDAAQARLAAGVFGMCEGCGGTIPLARLRALPTVRSCMACQARHETGR